jgi:Zn finger protein HypA/HybF involved in hydrogenase expression
MLRRELKTRDWVLRCNYCKATWGWAAGTSFQRIVDWLREKGWKAQVTSTIWEHQCPQCKERLLEARVDRERLHA